MRHRFVVVEGPIGAGKTTLAKKLASHWGAETLFEDPAANPFLPNFYRDMRRYALPTQLFFLFQRVEQLAHLRQPDLFEKKTVADFMLAKDPLFARLTLDDAEYRLYAQIYNHVQPQALAPDLVIYLQASLPNLQARVQRRGLSIERGISEEYLFRLSESYSRFFYDYNASPILVVNSDKLNFADEPRHFELLLERIDSMRGGREFFNRA